MVFTKLDSDYDYPYYDNTISSEYDETDVIEEDFIKFQKFKNCKSDDSEIITCTLL